MENNYYSLSTYNKLKKQCKTSLILALIILFMALAFLFISAFFININTVSTIKVMDILVTSLLLCVSIYLLVELYIPKINRKKFIYRLLTVNRYEGNIEILEIHQPYLIKKGIFANEIIAKDEDNKILNCFIETCLNVNLNIGQHLKVNLAQNFIVDIKEEK